MFLHAELSGSIDRVLDWGFNSFAAKFLGKRTSQCQIYFG